MINPPARDKGGNRHWSVTTAPLKEPISVDELKTFGRIDGVDEDALLEGFIKSVREAAEGYLGRAFIEQSITLVMDFWPSGVIHIPRPPLISITEVRTVDEEDVATVYDSDNYYIITNDTPGRLVLKNGATPPQNTDRYFGGFEIEFKAGYGAAVTDVPQDIRDGLKLWATAFYEERVASKTPPPSAKKILDVFRVYQV
jgi:uncharacterized phiE125 gp8 family phage protein